ncbi:uncharacterized protein [Amphiura filiformis]|uniref:uncharacterized protein n=1 Tax=Amphiura filiformis TaxID=82378 RepID=UPI003B215372
MPPDFRQFQVMMNVEFGERFNKLFRGPAWSGLDSKYWKDPLTARINVACLGYKAIRKDINKTEYTTGPEIQVEALKKLKNANPDGKFWLKADGTDIKRGLQESMTGKWNGDVDLLDGELEKKRKEYDMRRGGNCNKANTSLHREVCRR